MNATAQTEQDTEPEPQQPPSRFWSAYFITLCLFNLLALLTINNPTFESSFSKTYTNATPALVETYSSFLAPKSDRENISNPPLAG